MLNISERKKLWEPSKKWIKNAEVTHFIKLVNKKFKKNIKGAKELYQWSIDNIEDFWAAMWDFGEIINIIDNLSDLPLDYNYLSITLTSSFVIELLKFMPFLIINPHNKINMNYIFPRNNFFIVNDYNQLKAKIEINLN